MDLATWLLIGWRLSCQLMIMPQNKETAKPHVYFVAYRQKISWVAIMPTLSSVTAYQVVITTSWRAISDDKVGTMALLGFQCHRKAIFVVTGGTASCVMALSNGYIFPRYWPFLWAESTGHRWFPSQRPMTRIFDVFFDARLNKRLS